MGEFLQFLGATNLIDVGFFGTHYTWCNHHHGPARIWKRLDRVLIIETCYDTGLQFSISHLAWEPSNHAPLLMSITMRLDDKPHCFRFLATSLPIFELVDIEGRFFISY